MGISNRFVNEFDDFFFERSAQIIFLAITVRPREAVLAYSIWEARERTAALARALRDFWEHFGTFGSTSELRAVLTLLLCTRIPYRLRCRKINLKFSGYKPLNLSMRWRSIATESGETNGFCVSYVDLIVSNPPVSIIARFRFWHSKVARSRVYIIMCAVNLVYIGSFRAETHPTYPKSDESDGFWTKFDESDRNKCVRYIRVLLYILARDYWKEPPFECAIHSAVL